MWNDIRASIWEGDWRFLKLFSRSVVRVSFYQLCVTPRPTSLPLSAPCGWLLYTYWIITGAVQFHDVGVIHSGELAELCTNQRYMFPSAYSFIHIHSLSQCVYHIGACTHYLILLRLIEILCFAQQWVLLQWFMGSDPKRTQIKWKLYNVYYECLKIDLNWFNKQTGVLSCGTNGP